MGSKSSPKKKPFSLLGFMFESKAAVFLILVNTIVFFAMKRGVITEAELASLILTPGNLLEGKVWCLITAGFIHHDGMHLFLNMFAVFIFTRIVERNVGFMKTLFIYMGAMVIAMLFATIVYVFFMGRNVGIIGASGAVMGIISSAMLLEPFCVTYEMILPLPVMVKGWMFFYADLKGYLGGEQDNVSHLAHMFGFLSIALLVYFLSKKDQDRLKTGLMVNVFSLIAFLFIRAWLAEHF